LKLTKISTAVGLQTLIQAVILGAEAVGIFCKEMRSFVLSIINHTM